MIKRKQCIGCGLEFTPTNNRQKYSNECNCALGDRREREKERIRQKRKGLIYDKNLKCWVSTNKQAEHETGIGTTNLSQHRNPDFEREAQIIRNEKKNVLSGKTVGYHNAERHGGLPLQEKHDEILIATLYSEENGLDYGVYGIYDIDGDIDYCTYRKRDDIPFETECWIYFDIDGEPISSNRIDEEEYIDSSNANTRINLENVYEDWEDGYMPSSNVDFDNKEELL